MSQQKQNGFKLMQWLGLIIVVLSLLVDVNIIRPEYGLGPIIGFSYLASIGIVVGATITLVYAFKSKKMKT
ncbi:hypothetical protein NC661_03975 [Aquibacillus koreensis]|uniref:Uncharacterized protein n=1 Tax=Aquibacillus koreensis TaxID=279446 RepID=A0A9X3WLF1_9BACI|nr:hypothetical protein [Aquibacillus koreensis]MCT2534870.1 hypothetical protein [Aquibacillus koreensis]MDC3419519.1 hypothetical protein [Aquibacillus koreensis]